MLTISSIAVAPSPQQATPLVRAQPVTPAKPGQAVARDAAAPAQVAPLGDAARASVAATPPLAPVVPAQEAQRADGQANAAAPERTGLLQPARPQESPGPREQAQAAAQVAQQERSDRARIEEAARRAEERRAQRQGEERAVRTGEAGGQDEGFPPVKNPALEALDAQIKEFLPNLWRASRTAVDMVIGEEARQAAAERAKKLEELHNRLNARPLANVPPGEPQQTYRAATEEVTKQGRAGQQIDRLV